MNNEATQNVFNQWTRRCVDALNGAARELGHGVRNLHSSASLDHHLGQLSCVCIEDRDPDFESQYPRALEQDGGGQRTATSTSF